LERLIYAFGTSPIVDLEPGRMADARRPPIGLRWVARMKSHEERTRRAQMMPNGSVLLEAAAELARVDVRTIRQWAAIGAVEIEWRGEMEVVRLDRIKFLAGTWNITTRTRGSEREAIRGLLGDTTVDTPSVRGLQKLARERG
jgi:hypothetical protein